LSVTETPPAFQTLIGTDARESCIPIELPEQFEFELEQAEKAPFSDVLWGL